MADPVDSFTVPIDAVQPSQPYVNGDKLASVAGWFDFDDPEYGALPVRKTGGEWVPTDGHTRAFCVALAGVDELWCYEDPDNLPTDLYIECVGWCKDAGVERIDDLVGRVVAPETFERRWVERCQRAAERRGTN